MWSSNNCECLIHLVALTFDDFGNGHVNQFQVAPGVHHKVLGLDIPADDEVIVEVLDDHDHTGCVELTIFGGEQPNFFHDIVKVFSRNVFTDHEQILLSLEGPAHLDQKRVTDRIKDLAFLVYKLLNLVLLQFVFAERFDGVEVHVAVPKQMHTPELGHAQLFDINQFV